MAKKITKGESYFGKVFIMALLWAAFLGVVGPTLVSTPDTVLVIVAGVIALLLGGITYVTFFRKDESDCGECYDPRCRSGCMGKYDHEQRVGTNPDAPEGQKPEPPANPPSCGTGGCC